MLPIISVGVVVVWALLASIMLICWGVRLIRRSSGPIPPTRLLNPFYVGLCFISLVMPILAWSIANKTPRGSPVYGRSLVGFFIVGLILFAIGTIRKKRFKSWNWVFVPLIFLLFPLSLGVIWFLAFAHGFQV